MSAGLGFYILFVLIPPFDVFFYTWAEVNIFKFDHLWKFQSLIFMEVLFCIFLYVLSNIDQNLDPDPDH